MENIKPDILGDTADHSSFDLVSPSPGEHEEKVLLATPQKIDSAIDLRTKGKHKREPLVSFTIKHPIAERNKTRALAERWKLNQTDIARFLLLSMLPLLESPPEEIRQYLEAHRSADIAKEEAKKVANRQREERRQAREEARHFRVRQKQLHTDKVA